MAAGTYVAVQDVLPTPANSPVLLPRDQFSPYEERFEQHLIQHGVFPDDYIFPNRHPGPLPYNMDELVALMYKPRPALGADCFTRADYRAFLTANSANELTPEVVENVVRPYLELLADGKTMSEGHVFDRLEPISNGSLERGQPDVFHGAEPEKLVPPIRNELAGIIVPTSLEKAPIAPNFFLTVQESEADRRTAKRKATYHGALGARAIQALQTYSLRQVSFDEKAYTVSCWYYDGYLDIDVCHVAPPSVFGGSSTYHMTNLASFDLLHSVEAFRLAVGAYRNLRDWAAKQRLDSIRLANSRLAGSGQGGITSAK